MWILLFFSLVLFSSTGAVSHCREVLREPDPGHEENPNTLMDNYNGIFPHHEVAEILHIDRNNDSG